MKLIYQNMIVTILVNSGAILLGTLGYITPVIGAAIHNAATIAVVLNSGKIIFLGREKSGNELSYRSQYSRQVTAHCSSINR
jgi:cation-transporting P-type ATPase C